MRKSLFGAVLLLATPAFAAPTLSTISHPPMQIGTANVVDSSGQVVGAVQRVEVTPDGKPTEVAIALMSNQDHLVVLDAGKVQYDASTNRIIADASSAQLNALAIPD